MKRDLENQERFALQQDLEPRVFTLSQAVEYARGYIQPPSTKAAAAKTISAFTAAVGDADTDVPAALVAKAVDKALKALPQRGGGGAGGGKKDDSPFLHRGGRAHTKPCTNTGSKDGGKNGKPCGRLHPWFLCTHLTGRKLDADHQGRQDAYETKKAGSFL